MVSMRLIGSAQWKAERSKLEAEKVERDLRNIARERLLPDNKTLEKVSRYEAHLSWLFHKTLHELEALQTRRSGGVALLLGWRWTDWWRAKGRTLINLRGRCILRSWTSTLRSSRRFAVG
jgi:hypothetical protein